MLIKILLIILAIILGTVLVVTALYSRLSESKKRFVRHLAKQVKYLPGRYFS